jgi:hypothetical protein
MNFYNFIKEEYVTSIKLGGGYYSIFIDPNKKELQKLKKDAYSNTLRALYDWDNNIIYMFSSNLLHHYALDSLNGKNLMRGYFSMDIERDVLSLESDILPSDKKLKKLVNILKTPGKELLIDALYSNDMRVFK